MPFICGRHANAEVNRQIAGRKSVSLKSRNSVRGSGRRNKCKIGKCVQFLVQCYVILFNFGVSRAFVFLPAPNICEFQMNFEEKFTRSIHRRSAIATLHRFNCAGEYIWQELSLGGPGNANLLIGAGKNANQEIGVPRKHAFPKEMWVRSSTKPHRSLLNFCADANLKVGATGCFRRHVRIRGPYEALALRQTPGRRFANQPEARKTFFRTERKFLELPPENP